MEIYEAREPKRYQPVQAMVVEATPENCGRVSRVLKMREVSERIHSEFYNLEEKDAQNASHFLEEIETRLGDLLSCNYNQQTPDTTSFNIRHDIQPTVTPSNSSTKVPIDSHSEPTLRDSSQKEAPRDSRQEATRRDSSQEAISRDSHPEATQRDSSQEATLRDSCQESTPRDSSQEAMPRDSHQEPTLRDSSQEATPRDSRQTSISGDSNQEVKNLDVRGTSKNLQLDLLAENNFGKVSQVERDESRNGRCYEGGDLGEKGKLHGERTVSVRLRPWE